MIIRILFVVILGIISLIVILNIPMFKLKKSEEIHINDNGLIHFTSKEKAYIILNNGFTGRFSHMGFPESKLGPLVWFFHYGDSGYIECKHNELLQKERARVDKHMYEVCLRITEINKKDIKRMRTRYSLLCERCIVYRGTRLLANVELLKEWK